MGRPDSSSDLPACSYLRAFPLHRTPSACQHNDLSAIQTRGRQVQLLGCLFYTLSKGCVCRATCTACTSTLLALTGTIFGRPRPSNTASTPHSARSRLIADSASG